MAATNGRTMGVTVVVKVDMSATETPSYVAVGGQRNAKFHEERDSVDVTVKADEARKYEYGFYTWSMSLDGLLCDSDANYEKLKDAVRQGNKIKVEFTDGTRKWDGTCLVTSHDLEFPYEDGVTYSMELQGDGALVET